MGLTYKGSCIEHTTNHHIIFFFQLYLCEKVITYDYILTLMQSKIISYHDKKETLITELVVY